MPLPMVHLAIAVRLAARHDQRPSPAFLLGSLSPDAIHMRPDHTQADKQNTHLSPDTSDHPRVQALLAEHTQDTLSGFAAGYAAHLLTDRLWLEQRNPMFSSDGLAGLDEAAQRTLYYAETDQVDFNLYHGASWRQDIWRRLAAAEAVEFPPLLSAAEIAAWRDRTLRWFTEIKHEPKITPLYFTDELVETFIEEATAHVAAQFAAWGVNRIYLHTSDAV